MFAIYKRELKSYFTSFIGWLFIAVTLAFVSLYFLIYNLFQGYPYLAYAISGVVILFLISIPILSMRILSEERKNKTDQLILTAPVSVGGIVAGKFFALLTIFAIPTAFICLYPLLLGRYGTVPTPENYLAILGFFLYGMAAIAIGIFISSLTESQVISAVICFLVLFLSYMMSSLCSLISTTGNWLTKILGVFDMATPFYEMLDGTLNMKSVAYFILLTFFVLFLTVQSIQKRRYSTSVKNLSFGAYSTGAILLAAAFVFVVNLVISELPGSWVNIDITSEKLYSLTDQTLDYLKTIDQDVTIYVLSSESGEDSTVGQTLKNYADRSKHITVEYVDPAVNPKFYKNYTDSTSYNSLIVVSEKRSKVIDYSDLYVQEYTYNSSTYSYDTDVTGFDAEGQITSALNYVLSDEMPKMYMTEGHGESTLSSTFLSALSKENIEYETINLMNYDAVPEDAAGLLIYSALSDFSADDRDKVINYLDQGGKVIYISAYTDTKLTNLEEVIGHMGLSLVDGLIIEQDTNGYYRSPFYLLPTVKSSTYTTGVYNQYYTFAPFAQGLTTETVEGITYNSFLTTSDAAFSKLNADSAQSYDKAEGDIDGPFSIAVAATKENEDGTSSLMVAIGCSQFFTDDASSMVSGANLTIFSNTVSQFADHDVSVSIAAKEYGLNYLTIPQASAVKLGILFIIVIPVGCLFAGFIIWFRRRKR